MASVVWCDNEECEHKIGKGKQKMKLLAGLSLARLFSKWRKNENGM